MNVYYTNKTEVGSDPRILFELLRDKYSKSGAIDRSTMSKEWQDLKQEK